MGLPFKTSYIPKTYDDNYYYDFDSKLLTVPEISTENITITGNLKLGETILISTAAELNLLNGLTASTDELNILDGVTASTDELNIMDGILATTSELNKLNGLITSTSELNILNGISCTTNQLNLLTGASAGTVTNNKAVIYNSSGFIIQTKVPTVPSHVANKSYVDSVTSSLNGLTSSVAELNILDGVTASTAELNILDGISCTTNQLNLLSGVTSTAAEINILDGVTSTAAEINKLSGLTSTTNQLNLLAGASAGTVVNNKAVIYNSSGFIIQSAVPTVPSHVANKSYVDSSITNNTNTNITLTQSIQTYITQLGILTELQIDNIKVNGNNILSLFGSIFINPAAGHPIILDGAINIDAGIVTGADSITSTVFVGNLTGNASGSAATVTGSTQTAITQVGILTGLAIGGDIDCTGSVTGVITTAAQPYITQVGNLSNLTVNGTITAANTDTTHILGNAKIGNMGHTPGSWMGISHKDAATTTNYALIQRSDGRTLLNSASGQNIYFQQNNAAWMYGNSAGVTITPPLYINNMKLSSTTSSVVTTHIISNNQISGSAGEVFKIVSYNNSIKYCALACKGFYFAAHNSNGNTLHWYASSFNTTSDDRLKHNETVIQNSLETIMKLSAENYDFGEEGSGDYVKSSGFIAQEVEQIPELKHAVNLPNTESKYYSLNYEIIFTYAVSAIQELNTIVTTQAATISTLEAKLAAQEARIAHIESRLG